MLEISVWEISIREISCISVREISEPHARHGGGVAGAAQLAGRP